MRRKGQRVVVRVEGALGFLDLEKISHAGRGDEKFSKSKPRL